MLQGKLEQLTAHCGVLGADVDIWVAAEGVFVDRVDTHNGGGAFWISDGNWIADRNGMK